MGIFMRLYGSDISIKMYFILTDQSFVSTNVFLCLGLVFKETRSVVVLSGSQQLLGVTGLFFSPSLRALFFL